MNASIKQRETRIVTRNRTPENIHMAKSSYDWSIEGDEAKRKQDFKSALFSYKKAYESTKPEGVRYLVAKVSSCYRKINRPQAALNFYHSNNVEEQRTSALKCIEIIGKYISMDNGMSI